MAKDQLNSPGDGYGPVELTRGIMMNNMLNMIMLEDHHVEP
jgi:hypothetical protein